MGCNTSRAVSAITISPGRPDGAEADELTGEDSSQAYNNRNGIFYGGQGIDLGIGLGEYIFEAMKKHAANGLVAQIDADTDEVWSYERLLQESVQLAQAFRNHGLGTGDVVAYFTRNYHELFAGVLATLFVGSTVAAMVPTNNAEELRQQLQLCKARILFSEPALLPRAKEAISAMQLPVKLLCLRDPGTDDGLPSYSAIMADGVRVDPKDFVPTPVNDDTVGFILYSSGTTGLPKGVMIPNKGACKQMYNIKSFDQLKPGERLLTLSPISWISGILLLVKPIENGMTRIFIPDTNERKVLIALQKYKIGGWMTAPTALMAMMANPAMAMFDLSSLRFTLCGGSPLSEEVQLKAEEFFKSCVIQGYGCTETGFISCQDPVAGYRHGSLGQAQPDVYLRLVDPDTGEVITQPKATGEMRCKTPALMKGYIGNPEATAAAFDEEGWYRTGDLVSFDVQGNIFFIDRMKELMKFRSHQVAPHELEALLMSHPGVKDVCVIGRPHPLDGEHPVAFVVPTPGQERVDPEELKALVADRLSDPKRLRGGVVFLEAIPRTVTGKTMRIQLKQMLNTLPPPMEEDAE